MAQIGDTVRYLSATGGGKITRIEGKTAWVAEDNGFEMPVSLNEIVVVLPAGSKPQAAKLMFDQKAFDMGREERRGGESQANSRGGESRGRRGGENHLSEPVFSKDITPAPEPEPVLPKAPDTPHGEKLNIALAFEPLNIKELGRTAFNLTLVNDSNYTLSFVVLRSAEEEKNWTPVYAGIAEPNELTDLAQPTHEELPGYYRLALQFIAYKPDKPFAMKAPVSVARRLDLTKFYKLHCFRPGTYFSTPVLELKMGSDDLPESPLKLGDATRQVNTTATPNDKRLVRELSGKYRVDRGRQSKKQASPADNPNRLLPPIEVDLHIHALTDTTAGMSNTDMLTMQLDAVEATMRDNRRRIGQKIIFIHGKGNGVLRHAVLDLLKRKYPTAELQDASFAEYGFGATLVTVHQPAK